MIFLNILALSIFIAGFGYFIYQAQQPSDELLNVWAANGGQF